LTQNIPRYSCPNMSIMTTLEETICANLLAELKELASSGATNEFSLARIENAAKAARDADPRHYLYVMGAIAAFRNDVDGVVDYFERCITMYGGDSITYCNYAALLLEAKHYALAFVQAKKGAEAFPMDNDLHELLAMISDQMHASMWKEMEDDKEEELSKMCMMNFAAGKE